MISTSHKQELLSELELKLRVSSSSQVVRAAVTAGGEAGVPRHGSRRLQTAAVSEQRGITSEISAN